jgi:hypothetical protein
MSETNPHRNINDWKEYKQLVSNKLNSLESNIKNMDEKIDNLQIQNAIMTHTLGTRDKITVKVDEL